MPALATSPDADRRGTLRHPVKVAGTVFRPGRGDVTVTLTDISDRGAQIERTADFAKGASLRLGFAGFAPVDAAIVWSSPRAYGLRFEQRLHPALVERVVQIGRGRRRSPRLLTPALVRREERERLWHVNLAVQLAGTDAAPFAALLSDLSVDGCRIASAVAVLPGTTLAVTMPGLPPLSATARWCQDGAIGLEFARPLHAGLVEQIARG